MRDTHKTKQQLVSELEGTHQRLGKLGASEDERKRAAEALQESEEKFKTLIEDALIGIMNVDLTGKITYVNNTILQNTGYSSDDLVGRNFFRLGLVSSEMIKVLKKRLKEKLMGQPPGHLELQFKCKDGKWIWLQIRGRVLRKHNIPVGIQIIGEEITERKQAEEALRQSEENYRNIVELAPDGIMTVDTKGIVTSCNTSLLQLTGYDGEEIVGKHFSKLPPANVGDISTYFRLFTSLLEGQKLEYMEMPWMHKDGTQRLCEFHTGLIKRDGKITGIQAIIRDITEHKQAEEALRESEEKFFKAFRSSPDSIAIVTIKDGRFVDINDSFIRHTGYNRDEVIGRTTRELRAWPEPEERERIIRILREKGRVYNEEVNLRMKSGEIRTLLFSAEFIDIGGEPCMISVSTDITDRKQVEEELRESHDFLDELTNSMADMVLSIKMPGRIIEWVNSSVRTMGYEPAECVGRTTEFLYKDRSEFVEFGKKLGNTIAAGKDILRTEQLLKRKNGEVFSAEITATIHREEGEVVRVTSIGRDVTERREAEEKAREAETLKELDKLRAQLLANISHELRTPLASIKGFATMLLDYDRKLKRDEKRAHLKTIDENTDRLTELIEQLLQMSRLDAGLVSMERSPTSIRHLCRGAVVEARVRAPDRDIVLDLPEKLPRVYIDARRIRQVLDNLVDNAIKYSPPGTEVTVAARRAGQEVLVNITDRGVGIPKKDLPRVFDRMFRSRQRHIEGVVGVGLGLSICKGLVEAHGGRIWLESEESRGTQCFFTIPAYTR